MRCCCPPGGEPEVETPTTLLLEPRAIDHGTTELRDPSPTAAGLPRASSSSSHDPMPSHHLVRGLAASDESGGNLGANPQVRMVFEQIQSNPALQAAIANNPMLEQALLRQPRL